MSPFLLTYIFTLPLTPRYNKKLWRKYLKNVLYYFMIMPIDCKRCVDIQKPITFIPFQLISPGMETEADFLTKILEFRVVLCKVYSPFIKQKLHGHPDTFAQSTRCADISVWLKTFIQTINGNTDKVMLESLNPVEVIYHNTGLYTVLEARALPPWFSWNIKFWFLAPEYSNRNSCSISHKGRYVDIKKEF